KILAVDILHGLKIIKNSNESFDIIYADPPYNQKANVKGKSVPYGQLILDAADEGHLMKDSSILFIEESYDAPMHEESTLKTLELINSRRFGRSILYQYRKR